MNLINFALAASTLAFLAACGGGGGGGDDNTDSTAAVDNPLKKYDGTYYSCEGNDKTTIAATATGSEELSVLISTDLYQGANCSGNVIASYHWNKPLLAKYTGRTTVNMPAVTVLPYADAVDKITVSAIGITGTLTGSGVNGSCVAYSYVDGKKTVNGNDCFELVIPSTTVSAALYLSTDNKYLVQFSLENGVLEADLLTSRDPSFNIDALIARK